MTKPQLRRLRARLRHRRDVLRINRKVEMIKSRGIRGHAVHKGVHFITIAEQGTKP